MSFVWILWRSLMGQNKWGLHHWIPQKSCCSDSKRNGNASPSVANFTFTFYWLPDGRSGWTGKRHLIDQVHSKCSTSKWIMNADLSLLSGDNIFHLFEFGPNAFQPNQPPASLSSTNPYWRCPLQTNQTENVTCECGPYDHGGRVGWMEWLVEVRGCAGWEEDRRIGGGQR